MSGDYVAFEPTSLQQLSAKLDALAQTLDGNLSRISSIISAANGHVSGSGNVRFWTAKARADANDMASRSRKAWELVRQGQAYKPPYFGMVFSPGMVNVDWNATSKSGQQAQQDAKDLNLGRKATREQLAAAARSVANHKGDKAYLSTFWQSVDPNAAAELARILHGQDAAQGEKGKPLSAGSKKILADLAAGIAAASRSGVLSSRVQNVLENPPGHDMWSSAMLVKYGPKGRSYDPAFLKEMGAKVLDWRHAYGQMPSQASLYEYKAPDGSWYTSIGIDGPWLTPDGVYHNQQEMRPGMLTYNDWDKATKVIADNDPAASVLDRVGENSAASRALLQDKKYANDIVSPNWTVPKFGGDGKPIDISGAPGRVVIAATADRARFPKETAVAALNVFEATAAMRKGYPKDIGDVKGNLELKSQLPPDLTRALGAMGRLYIPDLLAAADGNPGKTVMGGNGTKVDVSTTDLKTYLSVLAKDPIALGIFRGGIDSAITQATRIKLLKGADVPNDPRFLGKLGGLAALAAANEHYIQSEAADMAAARNLQLLTTAVGIGTGVPLPEMTGRTGAAASWLKFLAGQGSGQTGDLFDTGHATEAEMANEKNYEKIAAQAKLPVAQGIYDSWRQGKMNLPPENQIPNELIQGDHLVLRDDAAVSRFVGWFRELPDKITAPYTQFDSGFHDATAKDKSQWEK